MSVSSSWAMGLIQYENPRIFFLFWSNGFHNLYQNVNVSDVKNYYEFTVIKTVCIRTRYIKRSMEEYECLEIALHINHL